MHRTKIVIWGNGGHALVVSTIVRAENKSTVVGFLVDDEYLDATQETIKGHVLGGLEYIPTLRLTGVKDVIVGIGNCRLRMEMAHTLMQHGLRLSTAIHPSAIVGSDVIVDAGTVISAGSIVGPCVSLGENVIVNSGAIVEHECVIRNGVHLSPGTKLAGRTTIGECTWIGIGATVIDKVCIGENCIIGAGALVLDDIPDNVVAYGVPARVIRQNK